MGGSYRLGNVPDTNEISFGRDDVFTTADEVDNGAFSALTIDPDGNTSEFGMRRVVR